MRQVRQVLGPDALIVSNRSVDGGVEVLATVEGAFDDAASETPQREAAPASAHAMTPAAAPAYLVPLAVPVTAPCARDGGAGSVLRGSGPGRNGSALMRRPLRCRRPAIRRRLGRSPPINPPTPRRRRRKRRGLTSRTSCRLPPAVHPISRAAPARYAARGVSARCPVGRCRVSRAPRRPLPFKPLHPPHFPRLPLRQPGLDAGLAPARPSVRAAARGLCPRRAGLRPPRLLPMPLRLHRHRPLRRRLRHRPLRRRHRRPCRLCRARALMARTPDAPLRHAPPAPSAALPTDTAAGLQDAISALRGALETPHGRPALGWPSRHGPRTCRRRVVPQLVGRGLQHEARARAGGPIAAGYVGRRRASLGAQRARHALARRRIRRRISAGGVYALVGPTGVGKTTTLAKLAARCVAREGRDQVAMLTTDLFRIGALEQLQIYGRLMGGAGGIRCAMPASCAAS